MSRGVWVVCLKSVWVLLKVLEGMGLPSTLASIAGGIARNELLLREGKELFSLDEVGCLDTDGGSEGPA